MRKGFFKGGSHLGSALAALSMSVEPMALLESRRSQSSTEAEKVAEEAAAAAAAAGAEDRTPPPPAGPESLLESINKHGVEKLHEFIMESAANDALKAQLSNVVDAVYSWADGNDHSFDALDGYIQAAAGIADDDEDPTDEEVDTYNTFWGYAADFLAALGVSDDDIETLADDEDDDAAATVAGLIEGVDPDDRDEIEAAFIISESSDDEMLTEAFKKVIRAGAIKLIRKPLRRRRMTSSQKSALKKARAKSHSGAAKLARKKSMKLRLKRFG